MEIKMVERKITDYNKESFLIDEELKTGQVYEFQNPFETFTRPHIIISNTNWEEYTGYDHPVRFCRITSIDHSFWNIPIVLRNGKAPNGFSISFCDTSNIIINNNRIIDGKNDTKRNYSVSPLVVSLINRIVSRDYLTEVSDMEKLVRDVYEYCKQIESFGYTVYLKANATSEEDLKSGEFDDNGKRKPCNYTPYKFNHNLPTFKNYTYVGLNDKVNVSEVDLVENISDKVEDEIPNLADKRKLKMASATAISIADAKVYCNDYENLSFEDFISEYGYSKTSAGTMWVKFLRLKSRLTGTSVESLKCDFHMNLPKKNSEKTKSKVKEPAGTVSQNEVTKVETQHIKKIPSYLSMDVTIGDMHITSSKSLYEFLCEAKSMNPVFVQGKYGLKSFKQIASAKLIAKKSLKSIGLPDDPDNIDKIDIDTDATLWEPTEMKRFISDCTKYCDYQIRKRYNFMDMNSVETAISIVKDRLGIKENL